MVWVWCLGFRDFGCGAALCLWTLKGAVECRTVLYKDYRDEHFVGRILYGSVFPFPTIHQHICS